MKIFKRNSYTLYLVRDGKAELIDTYKNKYDAAEVLWFFLKDDNSNG